MFQQCYTVLDVNVGAISYAFFTEAESEWQKVKDSDTLPSVAALCYLFSVCTCNGEADAAAEYMKASCQMGQRLNLFNVVKPERGFDEEVMSQQWRSAASYTAWGAYNWST
jgi:hypothetical protein